MDDIERTEISIEELTFRAARIVNDNVDNPNFVFPAVKSAHGSALVNGVAAMTGAAAPSITRARNILRYAPELEMDIVAGKISLKEAARKVTPRRKAKIRSKPPKKHVVDGAQKLATRIAPTQPAFLTREEMDPDFRGTALEFAAKYGHTLIETAEQRAVRRFVSNASTIARWAREAGKLEEVDLEKLRHPRIKGPSQALGLSKGELTHLATAIERVEAAMRALAVTMVRVQEEVRAASMALAL